MSVIADNNKNILGYNNNDNQFNSDQVVSNRDGSVIERQEYVMDEIDGVETKVDGVETKVDTANDKLGTPDELWMPGQQTVLSYANSAYQHIHMPGYVHPPDGSVIEVTTGNAAGAFGDFIEVVAGSEIEAPFDTHWVTVTNIGNSGVYIVELHIVDNTALQTEVTYLTAFSVARLDDFTRSSQVSVQMPPVPANSRIGARALNDQTGNHTISFNMHYHEYDV